MDKTLKITAIVTMAIIACSTLYMLVYRPIQRDKELDKCLDDLALKGYTPTPLQAEKDNCFKRYPQ